MALEDVGIKPDQSYIELTTCGTENLSPYSSGSGYSDQSSYCQTDYDWHQQQQHHQHYHNHHNNHHHDQHQQQQQHQHHQQQQQQSHTMQSPQLTDLSPRQYYSSFPETHELTPVSAYPAFSHLPLQQSDFYNPVLWPSGQNDYAPATSVDTSPRLFSGIDMSQHAVTGTQTGISQAQQSQAAKAKRKRVQSGTQRKAANVRERRRMFHLNEAFDLLRKRLPAFNYEKRLSRIETLRLAMTYISFMKDVSDGEDPKSIKLKPHGLDLDDSDHMAHMGGQDGSGNHTMSSLSPDYSDNSGDGMLIETDLN